MKENKKIEITIMIQTYVLLHELVDASITNEEIIASVQNGTFKTDKTPISYYTVTRPDPPHVQVKYKPDPDAQRRHERDNEREERSLQKASERADGVSYYNCNALSKVNDLAEELAKLPEIETRHATSIIYRKVKEKKSENKL